MVVEDSEKVKKKDEMTVYYHRIMGGDAGQSRLTGECGRKRIALLRQAGLHRMTADGINSQREITSNYHFSCNSDLALRGWKTGHQTGRVRKLSSYQL